MSEAEKELRSQSEILFSASGPRSATYLCSIFLAPGATLCQLPFQEVTAALRAKCLSNDKIPRLLHTRVMTRWDWQQYRQPGGRASFTDQIFGSERNKKEEGEKNFLNSFPFVRRVLRKRFLCATHAAIW